MYLFSDVCHAYIGQSIYSERQLEGKALLLILYVTEWLSLVLWCLSCVHRPECTILRDNWTKRLCSITSLQRKSGAQIDSCCHPYGISYIMHNR